MGIEIEHEMLRDTKYQEGTELVIIRPDGLEGDPADGRFQKKDVRFEINNRGSLTTPYDFYNAFINIKFKIDKKADGAASDVACGVQNHISSMIRSLKLTLNSRMLLNNDKVNLVIPFLTAVGNSTNYENTLGNELFFKDDVNHIVNSAGVKKRIALTSASKEVQCVFRLSSLPFFNSLQSKFLPPGKYILDIKLVDDDSFLLGKVDHRYTVSTFNLHIPVMKFNGIGEHKYLKMLSSQTFKVQDYTLGELTSTNAANGSLKTQCLDPTDVFIFSIAEDQINNPVKILGASNLTGLNFSRVQIFANGKSIKDTNPTSEKAMLYVDMLDYKLRATDEESGCLIDRASFDAVYASVYQPIILSLSEKKESASIELTYSLNAQAAANYNIQMLILSNKSFSMSKQGDQVLVN